MDNPSAGLPGPHPPPAGTSSPRWLVVVPIVAGLLLLMAAVVTVLVIVVRGLLGGGAGPGVSLSVVKVTPTVASPLPIPGCDTVISSGDVQTAASLPVSFALAGRSFPVVASAPGQGGVPSAVGAGTAAWTCGTVVNYVLRLAPGNEALLADLRTGDELSLTLSNGTLLVFRVSEWREAASDDPALFEQTQPRLTLIVEGGGGSSQVVTASYASETEPSRPSSDALVEAGQPVQVGDVEVTLTRGHAVRETAGLAPGTMVYLVEFSVRNGGAVALNAGAFDLQLQDGAGNRYLLSPEASAAGEWGPLNGQIPAGAVAQGTAGYLVPEALVGPALVWVFRPLPGSELHASVRLPYEQVTPEPAPAGRAVVDVAEAFLDGDVLDIVGEVRNAGTAALTLEVGDVTLVAGAQMVYLRLAAPPFPWEVGPGQLQIVELQYDRPEASSALLSLAGYSFEISGLR